MTDSAHQDKQAQHIRLDEPHFAATLSETLLSKLTAELDDETVTAIILHGSYAHGDATPYSDVDVVRLLKETAGQKEQKQFLFRDGYLINISTRTIAQYRERFSVPAEAIFAVPTVREAQILLDKEGAFSAFQQEARVFTWEPLQDAANENASNILMTNTEYVLKVLRAIILSDTLALSEMIPALTMAMTDAVMVQRGVYVISGNTYFHQAQTSVGRDSDWTRYHLRAAGVDGETLPVSTLEERGIAALRLYLETVQLLQSYLHPAHREVAEHIVALVKQALPDE
jgi:predicted nucleotidyltransferase